jgi:hypothetical protein
MRGVQQNYIVFSVRSCVAATFAAFAFPAADTLAYTSAPSVADLTTYFPHSNQTNPDCPPGTQAHFYPFLFRYSQRYTEITHDPLLFSVAQGIF